MKRIYVCSPLGEDMQESRETAELFAAYVKEKNELPVWPLSLLSLTDGKSSESRAFIRHAGKSLLWLCDEIWVFGEPSKDMEEDIHFAKQVNLPVRKISKEEINQLERKKEKQ